MGRKQLYAMADGDIPLHPCKQPFKECEIRRYDQPESAASGRPSMNGKWMRHAQFRVSDISVG